MDNLKTLLNELSRLKNEKSFIDEQINSLKQNRRKLMEKINEIQMEIDTIQNQSQQDDLIAKFSQQKYDWSDRAQHLLETVFGFKEFRSHQLAAINAILSGLDVLLIMPTGGGKSLCFQLASLILGGLTIVISPLISLIEDQLHSLKKLKIPAKILNKENEEECKFIMKNLEEKQLSFNILYVTPEKLKHNTHLMKKLDKCYNNDNLKLIVIDEIHCCSTWGHNFRPDYQFLNIVHQQFPRTPVLGLTATATTKTIADIMNIVEIPGCCIFKDSFYRSNLHYSIEWKNKVDKDTDELIDIIDLLKTKYSNQCGLIYCLKTNDVDVVVKKLCQSGISASRYYAGLSSHEKNHTYELWFKNKIKVIVATIAFGMGINKENVRFVIHYQMPKSLEYYYQETGRAGRDGIDADCILYLRYTDIFNILSIAYDEYHGKDNIMKMVKFCLNSYECRKKLIANHFNDEWNQDNCGNKCDNCARSSLNKNINENDEIKSNELYESMIELEKIINHVYDAADKRLTGLKLLELWIGKGERKFRPKNLNLSKFSRQKSEKIILHLLINNYLDTIYASTKYSIIVYIVVSDQWRSQTMQHSNHLSPMNNLQNKSIKRCSNDDDISQNSNLETDLPSSISSKSTNNNNDSSQVKRSKIELIDL